MNENLIYLAATLDSEGGIRIRQDDPTVYVRNTDIRLPRWLKENFGGSIYTSGRRPLRWKPCYSWELVGKQAATLLEKVLPHLLLKREQAELVIAYQATRNYLNPQPGVPRGTKRIPPEVLEQRKTIKTQLTTLNKRGVAIATT